MLEHMDYLTNFYYRESNSGNTMLSIWDELVLCYTSDSNLIDYPVMFMIVCRVF